jgi:hypothetical protein
MADNEPQTDPSRDTTFDVDVLDQYEHPQPDPDPAPEVIDTPDVDGDIDDADLGDIEGGDIDLTPAEDGTYTREQVEELQRRLELAEGLVDWEKVASAPEEPAAVDPATEAAQAIESIFTPREFSYTDDELEDILVEGNGQTLVSLLQRQAEVERHNNKIETVSLVAKMLQGRLPLAVATNNFYERYPELSGPKGEEIVERVFDSVWAKNPRQTSTQLLRAAEKQLSHVIARVKQVAANGGQKHNLSARYAGVGPNGTAPQQRRQTQQRNSNAASLAALGYDV